MHAGKGGAGRTLFHEVGKRHLGHRPVAAQRTNQLHQLQHRPDGVCLGAPAPIQVLPCRRMRLASAQKLASLDLNGRAGIPSSPAQPASQAASLC